MHAADATRPDDRDTIDVTALGNALVDVLSHESEDFIAAHGLERGAMTMIDAARAEALYAAMGPGTEMSGGSAANTVAGIASFGGSAAFIGKVRDDQLGEVFGHDLRSVGVHFDAAPATAGPSTGRCLVVVTPDAQRTLSTYLGTANALDADLVDVDLIARSRITYLEGYLWDQPEAKAAIVKAATAARAAGRQVAFTLSDPFCVDRHRAEFRELVAEHVDIVFANELEICSLFEVDDFDEALRAVRGHCGLAALTRSEKGSVLATADEVVHVDAVPDVDVVDTTGAGDLYAAGVLFGLTHGHDLATAGALGAVAAAEVIAQVGARPQVPLAELAAKILA
jgi:sugar/nucleoside kinase (ribokinase family)